MKKTVLITGASSGFGLMLATTLHQRGYQVVGTSRQPEKTAAAVPFKLLALDLDDPQSVAAFPTLLFSTVDHLDILVNNAGYMVTGLAEETPLALGREQFETNFWGTVAVTNALLPHFRSRKQGRIVTVSSIVGLLGAPNLGFYTASKHAVQGYFKALRFELDQFNIKVSMVEPMWFKTQLGHNAVAAKKNPITDYDHYRSQADAATRKGIEQAQAPDAVVDTIVGLIEAPQPRFSNPVGKMTGMILFLQQYLPKMFESAIHKSVAEA